MTKPRVVVTGTLRGAGLEPLRARYEVDVLDDAVARDVALDRLPGATAIVSRTSFAIDGDVLDAAGDSLEIVANFGVGYDNIDLDAARRRNVRVTNTPGVLSAATAELAVTLMLAAARRVAEGDSIVRSGKWGAHGADTFLGRDLVGATVGLVGFGRIGQTVARLLSGFDVRIVYADVADVQTDIPAQRLDLDELLAVSDFVSLHVAFTDDARHLINARTLGLMKPGSILVNTSRGAVVDTQALVQALREGRPAAAGLDVFEGEPDVPAELRELPNTVLLPHVGSATETTRDAMARLVADNVIAVLDGGEPLTPVV
ncbi:MAG TPA: D-glycerate dehydrogenase [Solirubrobacteraceae bacterium]|jgi:glyoxylate reductase|nr:D-glycerate dehydrogenase [Solirubrobacteraceae bacterium]